ncbi:MAG: hypothetical protein V4517_09085 [Pseudomonadota bacterium]
MLRIAGARHDPPARVLAPQRRLVIIGWISGAGLLMPVLSGARRLHYAGMLRDVADDGVAAILRNNGTPAVTVQNVSVIPGARSSRATTAVIVSSIKGAPSPWRAGATSVSGDLGFWSRRNARVMGGYKDWAMLQMCR